MTLTPYWSDDQIRLFLGDCLEVLAGMDAASVDAVVTDPPYGLEFMGKEWDAPWATRQGVGEHSAGFHELELSDGARRLPRPVFMGGTNPTCRNCGGTRQGNDRQSRRRCRCDKPDFPETILPRMRAYQSWCATWAAECLRVLKPGGHMLAFGGTRTWHRLTCAIEDAGFEIRETVADLTGIDGPGLLWLHSQGFPKNLNVSKAIDSALGAERPVVGNHPAPAANKPGGASLNMSVVGMPSSVPLTDSATAAAAAEGWGTALKPAWEPVIVARKPLAGTVARNFMEHGTGALNIDDCRVEAAPGDYDHRGNDLGKRGDETNRRFEARKVPPNDAGRWPPNVVLGPEAAAELDRQSGVLISGANPLRRGSGKFRDAYGEFAGQEECVAHRGADSGGASRFFPVFRYEAKAASSQRPRGEDGTAHPTVKPVDLIAWLCRLVTPPGGTVLDLFAGSGTTAEACIVEGFRCVLVEKDPAYAELIRTRLRKDIQPAMFGEAG